jgi:hypothetical protein
MSLVAGGIALNTLAGREHWLENRRQVPGGSSAGEKGMTLRPAEAPTGVVWTTDEVEQWRGRLPPPVDNAFSQSASPPPLERIAEAWTAVYEASPSTAAEACHGADGTASCDAPVTAASGGEIVLADGISTPPPKLETARDGTVAALLPSSSQSEVAMDHVAAPQDPDASRMLHAEPASGAAAEQDAGPLPRPVRLALQAGARNAFAAGNASEADRLLTLAPRAEMRGEDDDAVEGGAPPVEREFGRESVGVDPTGTMPAVGFGPMMPAQYRVDGGAVAEQTAPEPPAVSAEPTGAPVTSSQASSPSELLAAELATASSPAEVSPPAPADSAAEDSTVRNSAETVEAVQGRGSDVAKSSGARSPAPQARPPTATSAQAGATPPELVTALLNRGEEMVKLRDISGARLAYERAAAGGSVEAMTALGKTYDAVFLDAINAIGLRPDAALATAWYRKAAELGDAEAASRIRQMPPAAP